MKKLLFICFFVIVGLGYAYSQNPIKERITPFVELTTAFPLSGADAYTKCGTKCNPKQSVFKSFDDKVNQWKAHYEKSNPGNINMSDYTNPNVGTPGAVELNLMQTYGDLITQNQQLIVDYSKQIGAIKEKYEVKWIETMKNYSDEVSKCPNSKEGSTADASCVNPLKLKYEKILNQIIDSYIREISPVLNDYKSKIKMKNASMEDNIASLAYGDKVAMPATKSLIIAMQGNFMALVVGYGESVIDVWSFSCEKYNDIKKMKEAHF